MITLHKGELSWNPKSVIYFGRKYAAPLDLIKMIYQEALIEILLERKHKKK